MRFVPVAAIVLALVVACGGGEAAPSASPSGPIAFLRTPSPTPTASPSPRPTPTPAPAISLTGGYARQGGFLLARLLHPPSGLNAATVSFNGSSYDMVKSGDRWFAVIGLETDIATGEYPIQIASDKPIANGSVTLSEGGFDFESIELPESSTDLLQDTAAIAQERRTLQDTYAVVTPRPLWSGAWIMPAQGPITNAFGLQRSINGGAYFPHTGTDIANEKGSPVAAAASGKVSLARKLYLYGNAVVIDHGAGVFTSYNHLDSIAVKAGQTIKIGDLVGSMGETGFVSGPHLHWEAIIGGVRTDPTLWTQVPVNP